MKIVWDEHKRLTNLDKHGMDFADLTIEFFEAATIYPGKGTRSVALGRLTGGAIVVIFARLGTEAISIVSMRPASTRERSLLT
jgi:uncharacterized DUF497 family protein